MKTTGNCRIDRIFEKKSKIISLVKFAVKNAAKNVE
jgi:hypothetical protein